MRPLPAPTDGFFNPGGGGYGHRVFLPATHEYWERYDDGDKEILQVSQKAHEVLKGLCCWGGADKRWRIDGVEHLGYEFPTRNWDGMDGIRAAVERHGILLHEFSEKMRIETVN